MMKSVFSKILLIVMWMSLGSLAAYGQSMSDQILKERLYFLGNEVPYNKIYVSLNKSFYLDSDSISFQAYLMDPKEHTLIPKSVIGHFALKTLDGKILTHIKLRFIDGLVTGYFPPLNQKLSNVELVAYTDAMLNFDKSYFFHRKINFFNGCDQMPNLSQGELKVELFSEGGNLVAGVKNNLAVKLSYNDNSKFEGTCHFIKNSSTDSTSIVVDENGIGAFSLDHQLGKKYFISVGSKYGHHKIEIPDFKNEGLAINTTIEKDILKTEIRLSDSFAKSNEKFRMLITKGTELTSYVNQEVSGRDGFVFKVPLFHLPSGLLNVVVLDEQFQLVAERSIFNHSELFDRQTKLDMVSQNIQPRSAVKSMLKINEYVGINNEAHMSVKVTDAKLNKVFPDNEADISSYLMLSSELGQNIDNPNYYFTNEGKDRLNQMLITCKGSRINWDNITSLKPVREKIYANRSYLSTRGKAYYVNSQTPVPDSTLITIFLPVYNSVLETYTQNNGNVDLSLFFDFEGSLPTFYQAVRQDKGLKDDVVIEIYEDSELDNFQSLSNSNTHLKFVIKDSKSSDSQASSLKNCPNFLDDYRNRSIQSQLLNDSYDFYTNQEVKTIEKKDTIRNTFLQYLMLHSDYTKVISDYIRFSDIRELTKELLPEVLIRNRSGETWVWIDRVYKAKAYLETPLFIIDGSPTFDKELYLALDPQQLESVALISSEGNISKFGYLGKNGILIINSKKKSSGLQKNEKTFDFQGLQTKSVRSSNHSTKINSNFPDFRSVILWQPDVKIGSKGEHLIDYFHSDDLSDFVIKVEGVTNTGIPFSDELEYSVTIE